MPAAAGEREHEQGLWSLAQRILGNERPESRQRFAMDVAECRTATFREPLPKALYPLCETTERARPPSFGEIILEAPGVELGRAHIQNVPAPHRPQPRLAARVAQQRAQPRDQHV